jgi:hypothetical protein
VCEKRRMKKKTIKEASQRLTDMTKVVELNTINKIN